MVALTVLRIFSWVAIVGILSQTCNRFVLILLSVHSLANCLAIRVTSALASAIAFAVAISSLFEPKNQKRCENKMLTYLEKSTFVVVVNEFGQSGHQFGHSLCRRDKFVVFGRPLTHFPMQVVGGNLNQIWTLNLLIYCVRSVTESDTKFSSKWITRLSVVRCHFWYLTATLFWQMTEMYFGTVKFSYHDRLTW